MVNGVDKREFRRFHVEFMIEVSAEDPRGEKFLESTTSQDISGGGACFVTRNPERYFPGQKLDIAFYLPGIADLNARMKAQARVVRIESTGNQGSDPLIGGAHIAIKFDTLLNFERVSVNKKKKL